LFSTANSAILRLTKEEEWIKETLETWDSLRDGPPVEFNDKVFLNEINEAIIETHKAFSTMNFRNGLKSGYYDLQTNRNFYRASVSNGLNKNVLRRYMEVSILLLSPICPHWSQAMWELIGNQGLVLHQKWPIADPVDKQLIAISKYIQDFSHELRLGFLSFLKSKGGKGKKGSDSGSARSPEVLYIYVAPRFPDWQASILRFIGDSLSSNGVLPGKDAVQDKIKASFSGAQIKECMAFASWTIKNFEERGRSALETEAPFDEVALVKEQLELITRGLSVASIQVFSTEEKDIPDPSKKAASSKPLNPTFTYFASK